MRASIALMRSCTTSSTPSDGRQMSRPGMKTESSKKWQNIDVWFRDLFVSGVP